MNIFRHEERVYNEWRYHIRFMAYNTIYFSIYAMLTTADAAATPLLELSAMPPRQHTCADELLFDTLRV